MRKVNDEKLLAHVDSLEDNIGKIEVLAHDEAAEFGKAHGWNDELIADMTKLLIEKDERFNAETQTKELAFLKQFIDEVEEPAVIEPEAYVVDEAPAEVVVEQAAQNEDPII